MKRTALYIITLLVHSCAFAQYAPQAGVTGSTAISKNSPKFTGWATGCTVQRGLAYIEDPSLGYTTSGDETMAIGKPDNTLVSLGDSGIAVLTFSHPIYNGAGADFAVFENGFGNPNNPEEAFLELAFVEVSSDGMNYFRFPASSETDIATQVPGAGVFMNARKINNLAGKYMTGHGTPFDLEELTGTPGLDVNNITHIRIVDVIGSVGAHASRDKDGNIINDPYPTGFVTGGFDLDAVGALYQTGLFPSAVAAIEEPVYTIFPNPVAERLYISSEEQDITAVLTDISGKVLQQVRIENNTTQINLSAYAQGVYYLVLSNTKGNKWTEKIIKY